MLSLARVIRKISLTNTATLLAHFLRPSRKGDAHFPETGKRLPASERRRRFRRGGQLSDDEVEEEEEPDDADADVDHEPAVASAGSDHVVQAVDGSSEQTAER